MARPFREAFEKFAPERRAAIESNAEVLHKKYLALKDLRRARAMTQVQVAEVLGIQQATVAKMEKSSDMMLSTLSRFIEAMGGKLEIIATMPGMPPVILSRIGDIDEQPEPRRKKKRKDLQHAHST